MTRQVRALIAEELEAFFGADPVFPSRRPGHLSVTARTRGVRLAVSDGQPA